jgi:hypothetical protein
VTGSCKGVQARRSLLKQQSRGSGGGEATTDLAAELTALKLRLATAEADLRAAQDDARAARLQVDTLEEQAAAARHGSGRDTQRELQAANELLAERQSRWEAAAAERSARVMALERQLQEARSFSVPRTGFRLLVCLFGQQRAHCAWHVPPPTFFGMHTAFLLEPQLLDFCAKKAVLELLRRCPATHSQPCPPCPPAKLPACAKMHAAQTLDVAVVDDFWIFIVRTSSFF